MNGEGSSENVVVSVGAGVMSMMLVYALATDVIGLDKSDSRVTMSVVLALAGVAGVVRYMRLRRLGIRLSFLDLPDIPERHRAKYWLWFCAASILGTYSVYEVFIGGLVLGTLGCFASLSSTFVLARALLWSPRSRTERGRERGRC